MKKIEMHTIVILLVIVAVMWFYSLTVMAAYMQNRKINVLPPEDRKKFAVCVRNAYKSYGRKQNKNPIFGGLNMTVKRNTIYGLLGSSGCGKTTLLNCIIGRKFLDSGEIYVLGNKPGTKGSGVPGSKLGFMPQEISLYGEFKIQETLQYFGWLTGLTTNEITEKVKFLTTFLQLPSPNTFIRNLSGGQQRRVSLAAVLVHDPELLILDEPTVGVDPILRHSIWQHLVDITKFGNTTIILTTHYIDEMKQADCIGLVRGGCLLAEDTPQKLMAHFQTDNLEDAYLQLSIMQSDGRVHLASNIDTQNEDRSGESLESARLIQQSHSVYNQTDAKSCCNSSIVKKSNLKALVGKNFLWYWRNKPTIAFMLLLPIVQITLFALCIGGDPKEINLAVTNHELINWEMGCPVQRGCNASHLSCRFLQYLKDNNLFLQYFQTDDEALSNSNKGKSYAALIFPWNYSVALQKRINDGGDVKDWNIENSLITISLDKSNYQIAMFLWKKFYRIYIEYIGEYLTDCKYSKKIGQIPLRFNTPVYGESEPNYTDFIMPGTILSLAFFMAFAVTAGGLIVEKKEGLFERTLLTGATEFEILLSHLLADILIVFAQVCTMLATAFCVFSTTNEGSMDVVFSLTFLTAVSGMAYGYFISTFCDDERTMTIVYLGLFYPVITLCGMMWPREALPYSLQCISYLMPLTFTTDALQAILHRGWGLEHPVICKGFYGTFGWLIVYLVLSVVMLKLKKKEVALPGIFGKHN